MGIPIMSRPKEARVSFITVVAHNAEEMGDLLSQSTDADVAVVFQQDDDLLILAKGRAAAYCAKIPYANAKYGGGLVTVRVSVYPENEQFLVPLAARTSVESAATTATVQ